MPKKPCFGCDSKGEALRKAQAILRKYEKVVGTPITGLEADFVTDILLHHPRFEEKIGDVDNIDFHVVELTNGTYGGFRTKRRDTGQIVEWSYGKAIDG